MTTPLTYSTLQKTPLALRSAGDLLHLTLLIALLSIAGAAVVGVGLTLNNGLMLLGSYFVQVMILGIGFGWLLHRYAIRKRVTSFSFASALLFTCAVLTCFDYYLHDLFELARLLNRGSLTQCLFDVITGRTAKVFLQFTPLAPLHSGFAGDIVERFQHNRAFVRVMMISGVINAVALFVAIRSSPEHVWCRKCNLPWEHSQNLIFLPEENARELVNALGNEDADAAVRLTQLARTTPLGNTWAIGRLMLCRGCGKRGVDVVIKRFYRSQNLTTPLTEPIDTPDAFIHLLRSAPAEPSA